MFLWLETNILLMYNFVVKVLLLLVIILFIFCFYCRKYFNEHFQPQNVVVERQNKKDYTWTTNLLCFKANLCFVFSK